MSTLRTLSACLFASVFALAHAQNKEVQWPIDAITVYEQGAKVERQGAVRLDAEGKASITLTGLSTDVHAEMLQVALGAGWSLASHLFSTAVPSESAALAAQKQEAIETSMRSNRQTFALREAMLFTYDEEMAMIRSNRSVNGNELLLVDDLREHANFWRERVKELSYLMLELRMEMDDLTSEHAKLQTELDTWRGAAESREGQWTLRFAGPANSSADVRVSYVVSEAGWSPVYDAEVSESGQIQMKRYASAFQATGNDWEEVPVTFVVGNPLQSIAPPVAEKKTLGLAYSNVANAYSWQAQASFDDFEEMNGLGHQDGATSNAIDRYAFQPSNAINIPGDGTRERIYIEAFELDGDLSYLLMPEYSDDAYQLVNSGEWTKVQLVPGRVQVIAGGVYRGGYYMQLPAPGDTLQIPLGQDVRVRSSRTRVMDRCTSTVFGGSRKTTQSFEITLENQHNRPVSVAVQDAIPVANSSDIQVEVLGLSGGELDPVSGHVVWEFELAPNERRTLTFGYEITYPKRRSLEGL